MKWCVLKQETEMKIKFRHEQCDVINWSKQKYETDENILSLTSWNIFTSIFQGSYKWIRN